MEHKGTAQKPPKVAQPCSGCWQCLEVLSPGDLLSLTEGHKLILIPKSFLFQLLCLAILSPKGGLFPPVLSGQAGHVCSDFLSWSGKTFPPPLNRSPTAGSISPSLQWVLLLFFPLCFSCRRFYLCRVFPTQVEIQTIIILDILHSGILKIFPEVLKPLKPLCCINT